MIADKIGIDDSVFSAACKQCAKKYDWSPSYKQFSDECDLLIERRKLESRPNLIEFKPMDKEVARRGMQSAKQAVKYALRTIHNLSEKGDSIEHPVG